ncbi:MAG: hypothetical protein JKY32_16845, partial [Rhizobiales bacterium]|nr:hypothetical protein [Hyphomicrobiales bacterium]
MIDVVFSCLPEGFSKKETKRLVFAPVAELEAVLQTQAMVSLNRIIEAEAKINAGSFFNKPENNIGLIETNQKTPRPHPEHSTSLNKWFRLEFTAGSETGYFSAFQHVGQAWGAVSIHFDKNRKTILLPGVTDDGAIAFMRERQETGLHRFIVMHTPEPPPPEYLRYITDQVALDGFIIGRMAQFYDRQPAHR